MNSGFHLTPSITRATLLMLMLVWVETPTLKVHQRQLLKAKEAFQATWLAPSPNTEWTVESVVQTML